MNNTEEKKPIFKWIEPKGGRGTVVPKNVMIRIVPTVGEKGKPGRVRIVMSKEMLKEAGFIPGDKIQFGVHEDFYALRRNPNSGYKLYSYKGTKQNKSIAEVKVTGHTVPCSELYNKGDFYVDEDNTVIIMRKNHNACSPSK